MADYLIEFEERIPIHRSILYNLAFVAGQNYQRGEHDVYYGGKENIYFDRKEYINSIIK